MIKFVALILAHTIIILLFQIAQLQKFLTTWTYKIFSYQTKTTQV